MTAVVLLALGLTLSPQSAPPAPPPSAPAAAIPAPPPQPAAARAAVRHRRDEIGVMEGVLAAAVRLGAAQIAREMQAAGPGPSGLSGLIGQPRARGFILEGYGIFFNVDIPTLQTSMMWSMQQLQRDRQVTGQSLDALRSLVETLPDAEAKRQYQAALKRLEQQVGPIPRSGGDAPASNVVAETDEPDARYTKAVISSCLDAMLEHSKPMGLGPDEWLTVALTGADTTLAANQLYEASTVVLRVKGSDLADYFAGRLTRDEVRARVEVREF